MKLSKYLVSFALIFLIGCGFQEADLEGYILDVHEKEYLLVHDITAEEMEEVIDIPINLLHEENLNLIYINYENGGNFEVGDKVEVWLDGEIQTSHPGRAKAKKIERSTGE